MRWQILIPVASIISTCLAFSVAWWSSQRRKERESYYRFELSRLMLERYADGHERVMAWLGKQEVSDAHRRRDAIRLSAWVLILAGVGALIALRANTSEDSLFGWVPIGIGIGEFVYLLVTQQKVDGSAHA
jgi:hypothetical protein